VEFTDGTVVVRVDGQVRLSAPLVGRVDDAKCAMVGCTQGFAGLNTRGVVIGSVSGPGQGTLLFKNFEILQEGISVDDFAVGIFFQDQD
jgi:hypothetical protein